MNSLVESGVGKGLTVTMKKQFHQVKNGLPLGENHERFANAR